MGRQIRRSWLTILVFLCCVASFVHGQQSQNLDQQFKAAVAEYEAGKLSEAAAHLEKLLPHAPESFELHELLGLVYAGDSQNAKANIHLEKAVRLNPNSVAARTNLAANLLRLGKLDLAREQFRKNVRPDISR